MRVESVKTGVLMCIVCVDVRACVYMCAYAYVYMCMLCVYVHVRMYVHE